MDVHYSAEKDDLYYPAKHAVFFPNGRPQSDAALCVEMARLAYCRQDIGFAFDQDRIRKVLGGIRFTDCKFFESVKHPNGGGSHGFLALDEDAKLAVLAFRGTDKDDPSDLGDDLNAWPEKWQAGGNVHTGFAGALLEIWDQADTNLGPVGGYKLLVTGHSLGAAMATLAASLRPPAALYTFGCPRVGDKDFVAVLQKKQVESQRYVDCCDLVARIPPENVLGYVHFGDPHYIRCDRSVQQLPEGDPSIGKDQIKAEVEYLERYAWRIGDVAVRALADHAPVNYVWPVTAACP
jgi:hypothetical protein